MSLRALISYCLPENTARGPRRRCARADLHQPAVRGLCPQEGQPVVAPAQLALVSLCQFAEGLSDRQAAEARRPRIDWKYVLRLERDDADFDASVLCEFRARLVYG